MSINNLMQSSSSSNEATSFQAETSEEGDLENITKLVEECSAALTLAEPFVRNPNCFSLHDTMAATQLMDRKMDCCEIPASYYLGFPRAATEIAAKAGREAAKGDQNKPEAGVEDKYGAQTEDEFRTVFPRPPPKSLDDPFHPLPWNELTVRDAAIIGLEILVRLQSSLSGSSVGESTFTCLYAHAPVLSDMKQKLLGSQPLAEPFEIRLPEVEEDDTCYAKFVVFASALALVEATDVTRGIIMNADIYEEEDFSTSTHDIRFYTDEEEVGTLPVLEHAMRLTKDRTHPDKHDIELIMLILSYLYGFISICTALVGLFRLQAYFAYAMQHVCG